jgi:hypothetical protein
MTPEQSQEQNVKLQNEYWLRSQKLDCRRLSLEYASKLIPSGVNVLIGDSEQIYNWLTEDLK